MNRPILPRLGAACGIVFPIAMFFADTSAITAAKSFSSS